MTLYEIDTAILDCVDMETGEILDSEKWQALQMAKEEKISNTACLIKNISADAKAIKEEEDKLKKRRTACENLAKRLKEMLSAELDGRKFKDARCSIYFGTTQPTVSFANDDETAFIEWAKENAPEYLTYSEPTVNKTKLKDDISGGVEFSLASLEQHKYLVIK